MKSTFKRTGNKMITDTAESARRMFLELSIYKNSDIVSIFPDPYVRNVWAIELKDGFYAIVYLHNNDFEIVENLK